MKKFLSTTIRLAERGESRWRSSVPRKFVLEKLPERFLGVVRCLPSFGLIGLCWFVSGATTIFGQKNNPAPEGARLSLSAYAVCILYSRVAWISAIKSASLSLMLTKSSAVR